MTDSEILAKIKEICEESFNPDRQISDLHRAQALAIIYQTIIHRGANLLPQTEQETDQITIEEVLNDNNDPIHH